MIISINKCIKWLFLLTILFSINAVIYPANLEAEEKFISLNNNLSVDSLDNQQDKGSIFEKASCVQIPFVANEGQVKNNSVKFLAKTFGGTVFITKKGEIVYSLPKIEKQSENKAEQKQSS
ncbi:hypothetical protein L9W92_16100 [Pelotomaculum terephthalicicum JT]|uniref:hypothetical protein n=1 Tax=Pelotomaculum TaxID=191373 RepID=UPI0009CC6C17|nr:MULTISPECIES: hypothetical protein [Pelotomaculum]MCG9969528.1 hypothetical protein [Pelotomaculum terephthalicicum JT]OPX86114.1 MAG: hypothetical protein A4E54_02038 [Pelotomaculum sp. PtaB.Bin117]OPY59623.1 MAG: hypothetical protein A4E56_03139 [Pelotomaculum sp. PtaU1.Bin065]